MAELLRANDKRTHMCATLTAENVGERVCVMGWVQKLYLDTADAELMKGKRILIVDDVISTGESLRAIENLVEKAGGIICGKMTILAEGDAQEREDLVYLEKLPLFDKDGNVI